MTFSKILLLFIAASFHSCSEENTDTIPDLSETINFSGNFFGQFNCEGALAEENNTDVVVTIKKTAISNQYSIDLDDDLICTGIQEDDKLIIHDQTINEGDEFDVISLKGVIIKITENEFSFDLYHHLAPEDSNPDASNGESMCQTILVR